MRLTAGRYLGTNVFLGIQDVLSRKSLYATILAVLTIAAFIIVVPQNLYNTISSKDFSAYMGVGDSDLRVDIQQTDAIDAKAAEIARTMQTDPAVSKFVVLTTKIFQVRMADGTEERMKVELGDHRVFPVRYATGRAPAADDEIALSVLNAAAFGKQVGDGITLIVDGREKNLTICGTYSDITNGGKTAKAVFQAASADVMWSVITAKLAGGAPVGKVAAAYAERFGFAKVTGIEEYIAQTFGGTIRSVGTASAVAIAAALLVTALITLLFTKMLLAKDRYSIAVMKAFGFTNRDVRAQYVSRSGFVLLIGVLLGTFLANTLGEMLAGAAVASFGAASFRFSVNPWFAYLLSPLMMAGGVLLSTLLGVRHAGQIKIAENIKE